MFRLTFLLALCCGGVHAQALSVGVRAGVPVSDAFSAATGGTTVKDASQRLTLGPTVELRLPFGLGFSVDALYRRVGYEATAPNATGSKHGNSWQIPIMAKYRMPGIVVHPFVGGGVSFQTTTGFSGFGNRTGVVLGAGLDLKVSRVHITPELRYTRWGSENLVDYLNVLRPAQNQGDFLIGFTF
jgi:hypothetical protein